jgi:UPF0148 protein
LKEKKEDEIMAEYLLKGGKMLEKTCRQCGCPQFEYKGKTFCVVCAERGQEKKQGQAENAGQKGQGRQRDSGSMVTAGAVDLSDQGGALAPELAATLLDLCRRVREEEDPDRCLALMDSVKIGTEALQILRQL